MEESGGKKERRKVGFTRIFSSTVQQMLQSNEKINKSRTLPITVVVDNSDSPNSDCTQKHQHEQSSVATETDSTKRFPEAASNDKSYKKFDEQGFDSRKNFDRHAYDSADNHNSNCKRPPNPTNNRQHNGSFHRQSSKCGQDFDGKSNIKLDNKCYRDTQSFNARRNFDTHTYDTVDRHNAMFKQTSSNFNNSPFHRQSSNSGQDIDYRDCKINNMKPDRKSHLKKANCQSTYFKQYSDSRDSRGYKNNPYYQNLSRQYSDSSDNKLHDNAPNDQNTYFKQSSDYGFDELHKNSETRISDYSNSLNFHPDKLNRPYFRSHSGDSSNQPNMHNSKPSRDLKNDSQKSLHNSDISKRKYKSHEDRISHSDTADKELDSALKNQSAECVDSSNQDKYLTTSDVLCTDNAVDEESENVIQFSGNKNERSCCLDSGSNLQFSLKNDLIKSPVVSDTGIPSCTKDVSSTSLLTPVSTSLPVTAANTMALNFNTSSEVFNDSLPLCSTFSSSVDEFHCNTFENISSFIPSSEDDFIPPPVMSATVSEENKKSCDQEVGSSNASTPSENNESCFSLPGFEHLEAISNFITKVKKMKTVNCAVAIDVVRDLNRLFKDHLEGNIIEVYGSYDFDLAISTSDINFVIKADVSLRKSFMYEVYKVLKNELSDYHILPYEEGVSVHLSKIHFSHPVTGVSCQLAYLGRYQENVFKMGKFLKRVCLRDPRVRTLILAAKIWAEQLRINEVEDGKLHPIGFVLLVIHFLQHCENPILPIYNFSEPDLMLENLPLNKSSVGELWLLFLKYYSMTFKWQQDVVTVTSKESVSKKSKQWGIYWMAIEDPFSGKNVAEKVVNCDVADHIKACFKSSLEHFMSPPRLISPSDDNEEPPELEFSFDQCIADQTDSYCEMCDEIDDVCEDCQKKYYQQPMATLPKMTDSFLKKVKEALLIVYEKYMLSDDDIKERKNFVSKLQDNVCKVYREAELNLIGSSTNGFGFQNSDLDICMTFKNPKGINSSVVLKNLRRLVRRDSNFENVIAIFDAKIPILKFCYKPKGWFCDISLNNILAVHNSELLYTYSLIDERCKILGCALKLLAKKAMIAEVTDKALSSYSYLNMVIHFLQQTEPPVLPVLQDNKYRKENFELNHIVDNWNVWFCKDLDYIKEVFKSENDTPVEQLFLDLLDYYCSYDSSLLISIREKEIKALGEKQKAARLFNIQDPFIETKNLGCVVSASKAQETKSVFNRARQLFRTPITDLPSFVKDIEEYFFSSMSLTGRIQKEVQCEMCNKFGHEKKDCSHTPFFQFQKNNFNKPKYHNSYAKKNAIPRKPIRGQSFRKRFD